MKNQQEVEKELDALECTHGHQDYTAGAIDALLWVLGRISPVSEEEFNHE